MQYWKNFYNGKVQRVENSELEKEFGEQVPVILINNKIHDYWKVDLERFTTAIKS